MRFPIFPSLRPSVIDLAGDFEIETVVGRNDRKKRPPDLADGPVAIVALFDRQHILRLGRIEMKNDRIGPDGDARLGEQFDVGLPSFSSLPGEEQPLFSFSRGGPPHDGLLAAQLARA